MDRELMERLARAQYELSSRLENDPWFAFKPSEKQRPFISAILDGTVTEAWAICANRSGKSESAAYVAAGLARFGRRPPGWGGCGAAGPTKGWVISATDAASRTVVQPKLFDNGLAAAQAHRPFIPDREIKDFNKNFGILTLKNGSVVEFKSAETATINLAGAGLDWIYIDEEIEKAKYDELGIRLEAGRRLLIFGACTLLPPEGVAGGVSWMFPVMIKPWLENPQKCAYRLYSWSIYDNPHLLPEEIAKMEAKYPVGSVENAIRLQGEWLPGLQGSRAYTAFDHRLHVRPQPALVMRRPVVWTWDFNVEPMVSLIGQRDGMVFRINRELVIHNDASVDQMVQYFHEVVPSHHGEVWVYGDASGKKRNDAVPGGRSEYALVLQHMRTYGSPVRLKVPDSNPLVTDRINAVNRLLKDETGAVRVEIDPSCEELIADLEQVLRDNKGGIKKVRDRKDPYFKRTHASDALGYWINYEEPVRSRAIGERHSNEIRNPSYFSR